MHEEARETLPQAVVRDRLRRGLLLGHSDGASIATIYAGSIQDHRVRGLVLIAPHFFVEDVEHRLDRGGEARLCARPICARKLARWHHADVDNAFRGWNDVWLDPQLPRLGYHPKSSPISACRS